MGVSVFGWPSKLNTSQSNFITLMQKSCKSNIAIKKSLLISSTARNDQMQSREINKTDHHISQPYFEDLMFESSNVVFFGFLIFPQHTETLFCSTGPIFS